MDTQNQNEFPNSSSTERLDENNRPHGLHAQHAAATERMSATTAGSANAQGNRPSAHAFASEEEALAGSLLPTISASELAEPRGNDEVAYTVRVKKKKKDKGKTRKILLGVILTLLAVLLIAGGGLALYIMKVQKAMSFNNEEEALRLQEALVAQENKEDPFYVLVLGSDARDVGEDARSDVIILMRVDPNTATLTMVSIPRDTMVELPEYGRSKINAAFAYDGPAGAVKAVSDFAGVPISHYAQIDFEGLTYVVDKLGGVTVNVPVSNTETGASNTKVIIEAGEQYMDGETALAFARERYGYNQGDFQRTENQRILLQAILNEIMSRPATEVPGLIEALAGSVSTDYSVTDLLSLTSTFQDAGDITIYSAMVPSSTLELDGVSYVTTDHAAWATMLQNVEAGVDPNAETVVIEGEAAEEAAQ